MGTCFNEFFLPSLGVRVIVSMDCGVWLTGGYEWCVANKGQKRKRKKKLQDCNGMFNGDGIVDALEVSWAHCR